MSESGGRKGNQWKKLWCLFLQITVFAWAGGGMEGRGKRERCGKNDDEGRAGVYRWWSSVFWFHID